MTEQLGEVYAIGGMLGCRQCLRMRVTAEAHWKQAEAIHEWGHRTSAVFGSGQPD